MSSTHIDTDRLLMDVAYMGALYGLGEQTRTILTHLSGKERCHEAAALGEALALLMERRYVDAAQLLEKQIEAEGKHVATAEALLSLVYRLGAFSRTRADDITNRLNRHEDASVRDFADKMRHV